MTSPSSCGVLKKKKSLSVLHAKNVPGAYSQQHENIEPNDELRYPYSYSRINSVAGLPGVIFPPTITRLNFEARFAFCVFPEGGGEVW